MDGKQLRNSILQWAIQGKLVPQDPNDEPASVLLERIREEKSRLVKEKKLKRDKNESIIYRGDDNSYYEKFTASGEVKCIDDEIPFDLPNGWCWVRLKYVAEIARGGSPRPIKEYLTTKEDGVNWIKIGDTTKGGKYIESVREKIKPAGVKKSRMVSAGDFLLTNSMSFGRPYILKVDGCIHDGWLVISLAKQSYNQDFLYYLLSSPFAFDQFCDKVSGAVVKNLNSDKVANAIFPIPPANEQLRIAQAIEGLMPYVEHYSEISSNKKSMDDAIFARLRKSILQEAIQGKLVEQNPDDEPASVLLERIKQEKERLIKEKKIKRDKQESIIYRGDDNKYYERRGKEVICIDDEIPFEIPNNWMWVRGRTAFLPMESTKPKGEQFVYIDVAAVNNKTNIIEGAKTIKSNNAPSRATRKLHLNDILFSMVRPYLRNIALVTNEYSNAIASTGYYVITPSVAYNPQFLFLLMMSPYVVDGLNQYMKGDNSPSINNADIEGFIFPLPPLCEQQRIVDAISVAWQVL